MTDYEKRKNPGTGKAERRKTGAGIAYSHPNEGWEEDKDGDASESIDSLKERMMPSPKPTPSPKFEDGMKKKLTEKMADADEPRPVNTAAPTDIGGNAAYQKKLREWKARTGKE